MVHINNYCTATVKDLPWRGVGTLSSLSAVKAIQSP